MISWLSKSKGVTCRIEMRNHFDHYEIEYTLEDAIDNSVNIMIWHLPNREEAERLYAALMRAEQVSNSEVVLPN